VPITIPGCLGQFLGPGPDCRHDRDSVGWFRNYVGQRAASEMRAGHDGADVERAGVRDRGRRRSRVAISGIEEEHNCAFWHRVALKP